MFWNDIKEIKTWMIGVDQRLQRMAFSIDLLAGCIQEKNDLLSSCANNALDIEDAIKESILEAFESEDEFSSINRIHDKLNSLIKDNHRKEAVLLAEKTLDKFDDYMKNVDKLNSLVNEFKGCVSMARGAIAERQKVDKQCDAKQKAHKK